MEKLLRLVLIAIVSASSCIKTKQLEKPVNIGAAKKSVITYYEKGGYTKDLKKIIKKWWRKIRKKPVTKKTVVIMDIDDTVISSYLEKKALGFGSYSKCLPKNKTGKKAIIKEVFDLYKKIMKWGYKVIFITGRSYHEREKTIQELREHGITNYTQLILRSPEQHYMPAAQFKENERAKIVAQGYKIIGCIGDQLSDCEGKETGIKLKLPNYLYTTY